MFYYVMCVHVAIKKALKMSLDAEMASRLHAMYCDVSDLQSIRKAFEDIEKQFTVVNILINNAGMLRWVYI